MTERRPHWSDDLVEAVRSKIGIHQHGPIGEIRIYNPFDDEVYNVIAAVEDWARWEHVPKGTLRRLEQAEAAIARVRDLHCLTVDVLDGPDGPEDVEHCQECGYISIDAEPCPTIRAIEGEL